MSYAPASLLALRAFLKPHTDLADNALGIVGDAAHRGGYHCGKDRLVSNDYSNRTARDRAGLTNAASAIDIGNFSRLRELSVWLAQQCSSGTADTAHIREVIYSPDGRTVRRWDREGRSSTGDDSHLWHTHISFYRDSETHDKTAVFQRFFGGTTVPTPDPSTDWTRTIVMSLPLLKRGAKGIAVNRLQALLNVAGQNVKQDGDFGPKTEAAVRAEQSQAAIGVDGEVGKHTWSVLLAGRDLF